MFDDCLTISIILAAEILLFRFAYQQRQAQKNGGDKSV